MPRQKMWFFFNEIQDNFDEIEILCTWRSVKKRNAERRMNTKYETVNMSVLRFFVVFSGLWPIKITCDLFLVILTSTTYSFFWITFPRTLLRAKYYHSIAIDDFDVFDIIFELFYNHDRGFSLLTWNFVFNKKRLKYQFRWFKFSWFTFKLDPWPLVTRHHHSKNYFKHNSNAYDLHGELSIEWFLSNKSDWFFLCSSVQFSLISPNYHV